MNTVGFKRFLTNKNTVTIIGVLLGITILYLGYTWRVNDAIQPAIIPYAKKTIQPRTKITEDMVGEMSIPKNMIKSTVLTNKNNIIGKYVNINATVPEGSLFYSSVIVEQSELPNAFVFDIPENYTPYNLSLSNSNVGYGILPDTYIDVYVKVTDDQNMPMVGKLVSNVKVSVVLDKNNQAVYDNLEEDRVPSVFIFAVPDELHLLLIKASYLTKYNVEIFPVVANGVFEDGTNVTQLSSSDLKSFIEEKTVNVNLDDTSSTLPNVDFPEIGN